MEVKGKVIPNKIPNKVQIADWVVFALLFALYTVVTGYLFYHQAIGNEEWFHSDIGVYLLEMQGLESGADFSYPVFFKLGAFFDLFLSPERAITVTLLLLNGASLILLKWYLSRRILPALDGQSLVGPLLARVGISLLSVCLLLVSMLSPILLPKLPGIYGRYRGVFTPNPYHNATYLAVRPFAILCFIWFVDLLQSYEEHFSWKKGLAFSALLLLATMTKPTFTLVLVACAGLIMLYRLLRSRFGNFKASLCLGICFIPTFCDLLYQFFGMFGPKEADGSGMAFGWLVAWRIHCGNIPLAILLAWGFPLAVLAIHHKELGKKPAYRFSWQFALTAAIMMMVLYENGARSGDMNFSWGYMHGLFFAFVESAIVMAASTLRRDKKWYLLGIEWLMFFWHLGCGLLYFRHMLLGLMYY